MSVLEPFLKSCDADETWNCTDGAKELKNLKDRKNDMFPQGRDNCKKFLKECAAKNYPFKVKAKKTKPYWTWYFELEQTPIVVLTMAGLADFANAHPGDQSWDGDASGCPKELKLLNDRKNDIYPQGRDNCGKFLHICQERGYRFKITAKKTKPYWTWFYEIKA